MGCKHGCRIGASVTTCLLAGLLIASVVSADITVDDDDIYFVFDENIGTLTHLTWKHGSSQELIDQSWNNSYWVGPFRLVDRWASTAGYHEVGNTVESRVVRADHASIVLSNPEYGSKQVSLSWGPEGLVVDIEFFLNRSDLFIGGLWEPGGDNTNLHDRLRVYDDGEMTETPFNYSAGSLYWGYPDAIALLDDRYDEVVGFATNGLHFCSVYIGSSVDGPLVYLPAGWSRIRFALTSIAHFDEFVLEEWTLGPPDDVVGVSSVRVKEAEDSASQLEISYDLTAAAGAVCTVWPEVSFDGGVVWLPIEAGCVGDLGSGVAPGTGKMISWDASLTSAGVEQAGVRVRIVAEDGSGNTSSVRGGMP